MKTFRIRTLHGDDDAAEVGRLQMVICEKRYFFVLTQWRDSPVAITHLETGTKICDVFGFGSSDKILDDARSTLRRAVAYMGAKEFSDALDQGMNP